MASNSYATKISGITMNENITASRSIDLSIVIPAYNEKESITPLFTRLQELLQHDLFQAISVEILLIDDGSTDGTWPTISEQARQYALPLRSYRLSQNSGQSKAFLTGFELAQGSWIATLDADLQNDPLDLPRLFHSIGTYDCIVGRRKKRQDVWWKKALSRISNRIRRVLIDDGTLDSGSSLKLFRKQCTTCLPHFRGVHRLFPAFFRMAGYRITEIEVSHCQRQYGTSKYSFFSRGISILCDFLATSWLFYRKVRPTTSLECLPSSNPVISTKATSP